MPNLRIVDQSESLVDQDLEVAVEKVSQMQSSSRELIMKH